MSHILNRLVAPGLVAYKLYNRVCGFLSKLIKHVSLNWLGKVFIYYSFPFIFIFHTTRAVA